MKTMFFLIMVIAFSISSFSQNDTAFDEMLKKYYKGTVETIPAAQLYEDMQNDTGIVILDAREKREYDVSHLKNAVYVGFSEFSFKKVKKLPKDAKIIVYCSIGARSENIGEKLLSKGFKNVYNLYGGIFDWKNKGYQVYDNSGEETEDVFAYSKEWGVWLKKGNKVYE